MRTLRFSTQKGLVSWEEVKIVLLGVGFGRREAKDLRVDPGGSFAGFKSPSLTGRGLWQRGEVWECVDRFLLMSSPLLDIPGGAWWRVGGRQRERVSSSRPISFHVRVPTGNTCLPRGALSPR